MTACTLKPGGYQVIDSDMKVGDKVIILHMWDCEYHMYHVTVPVEIVASGPHTGRLEIKTGILTVSIGSDGKESYSYSKK